MNLTEVTLVISLVINLFSIVLLFIMFMNIMNMKNQLQQVHTGLATALTKLFTTEHTLVKLSNGFTEFIRLMENAVDQTNNFGNKILYKTSDGKYTANTVDELIDKIKQDGNSDEYFTDDELDKLKKMFDPEDDSDDDRED